MRDLAVGFTLYDVFCKGVKIGNLASDLSTTLARDEAKLLYVASQAATKAGGRDCLCQYHRQNGAACEDMTIKAAEVKPEKDLDLSEWRLWK